MGHRAEKNRLRHGYKTVLTAKRTSAVDEYRREAPPYAAKKGAKANRNRHLYDNVGVVKRQPPLIGHLVGRTEDEAGSITKIRQWAPRHGGVA